MQTPTQLPSGTPAIRATEANKSLGLLDQLQISKILIDTHECQTL